MQFHHWLVHELEPLALLTTHYHLRLHFINANGINFLSSLLSVLADCQRYFFPFFVLFILYFHHFFLALYILSFTSFMFPYVCVVYVLSIHYSHWHKHTNCQAIPKQGYVMLFLYFHLLYLPFSSYLFICNPRQVPHSNTVNRTACFRMSGLPLYVTQLSNHQQYTYGRSCKLWLNNKCAIYFTDKADCIREKLLNA